MITNGLRVSLRKFLIKFKGRTRELDFEKYFLMDKQGNGDVGFGIYTEKVINGYRVTGNSSVRAQYKLF